MTENDMVGIMPGFCISSFLKFAKLQIPTCWPIGYPEKELIRMQNYTI